MKKKIINQIVIEELYLMKFVQIFYLYQKIENELEKEKKQKYLIIKKLSFL